MTHLKQNLRPTRDPGLVTIAIFKLFKGVSLIALGLGAILYGSLFTVEGVGLWKGKRWAEYLTVIATSTLIAFELYELARRLTMVRVSALVVNVAAVIYLVYRLRHPRAADTASAAQRVHRPSHAVSGNA
jgi:uncharacterized membrane protein (DUF2068 family)